MALVRWSILGLLICAWPARAAACGGGGVTTPTGTATSQGAVANAQRVVISVTSRGTTETIVQIGVPETSSDYGVLIPTPTEPTLDPDPISAESLDELDARTRPTIVTHYFTPSGGDGGSGCSCMPIAGSAKSSDDQDTGTTEGGVSASQPTNIGPVTATVVTANDASGLNAWLETNGFSIPPERADLVAKYVQLGRYFIAVKRNDATVTGGATSIGLHYSLQGNHRQLSLGFARLGAAPTVAFTLFLYAETPTAPSLPFVALSLHDLAQPLYDVGPFDYQTAIMDAVKGQRGEAFVLEASEGGGGASGAPFPPTIVDHNAGLLRMTTVLPAEDLKEDVTFFAAAPPSIERTLTVDVEGYPPKSASFGLLGLITLAWGARRRQRA